MHRIQTTINHARGDFDSEGLAAISQQAADAATVGLRRVGGERIDWGRRGGPHLDSARLAFAGMPDARLFGRYAEAEGGRPALGVTILIDASGSMNSSALCGGVRSSRSLLARSIAVGIASAAGTLGLPVVLGSHGENGRTVRILAHRSTRGALRHVDYGGNRDAFAVQEWARGVAMPGERNLTLLVCDGAPTDGEAEHRAAAADAVRILASRGSAFAFAFIGCGDSDLQRARADWGYGRVADCRRDMRALASAIVRGVSAVRC